MKIFEKSETVIFIPTVKELEMLGVSKCVRSGVFLTAMLNDCPVIVTGIGKSNASFAAAAFLSAYGQKKCLLAGICGAYPESGFVPGDVVCVRYDHFVDEGKLFPEGLVTLHETGMSPCDDNRAEFDEIPELPCADSNTVSLIPATDFLVEIYRKKTGASLENMEGAAFGAAVAKFGARAFQLRAVSNFCGSKEMQKWNIKAAAAALSEGVSRVLPIISEARTEIK